MGSNNNTDVVKLTGANFESWRITLEAILVADETWPVVGGKIKSGEKLPANAEAKAYARLIRSISADVLVSLPTEDFDHKPKKLWDHLVDRYQKVNAVAKMQALKEWAGLSMTFGKAKEYIEEYSMAARKLKQTKCAIDDEIIYLMFLGGLPNEMASIRQAIASSTPDLETAKQAVLTEEKQLKTNLSAKESPNAFYTGRREVKCYECGKMGHYARECQSKKDNCGNCGGRGHTSRQCSSKPRRGGWRKNPEKAAAVTRQCKDVNDSGDSENEINELSKYYRSFFTGPTEKAACYLDSCASDHYLVDKWRFKSLTPMKDVVNCANKTTSRIAGRGDVVIECKVSDKSSSVKLTDAKWIPGFFGNLISVSRLCDDGYKVLFVGRKAYVTKGKETVMIGVERGGIFAVTFDKPEAHASIHKHIANAVTAETWHMRFGHPGKTRTELLKKCYPNIDIQFMPWFETSGASNNIN